MNNSLKHKWKNLPAPKYVAYSARIERVKQKDQQRRTDLDRIISQQEKSLYSLIEIGTKGHYPLFDNSWLNEIKINLA